MENISQSLGELLALEVVLSLLFLLVVGVVGFFVCRLLLAISKFFEAKTKALRHDLAVNNYREDD